MAGKLFIISAPSGTGKTTLVNTLLAQWEGSHELKRVVTTTTRTCRPHEVNGVDYDFISLEEFKIKVNEGFFLETNEFCGNFYGSPRSVLDQKVRGDSSFIFIIDQEGARSLKGIPGVILIWIKPPSLLELTLRLQKRGEQNKREIERRVQKAEEELEREAEDRFYHYHLVNDDFSHTLTELKELIGAEIDKVEGVGN